jgi:hypothetical protein
MHRFHAPAARDELGGQPVEQFGVRRRFAHLAEVARRAHDALAEVMLPDAVHHHPRREGVIGRDEPLGKTTPRIG